MEQNAEVLENIREQRISDPAKCSLCFSVYKEFLESDVDRVLMDYDPVVDEIFLILTRNGNTSICIPRSYQDSIDLTVVEHFRKKVFPEGQTKPMP